MQGLRLALSWLSVLPIRVSTDADGQLDTSTCRSAIRWAPLVGAALGAVAAALLFVLRTLGAPGLVAALVTLAALVLLTRGMHVDGLADTVDGLGCYGPPERALQVMRDGNAGPFAVTALVLVLGVQASALAVLCTHGRWGAIVLGPACGRAAFLLCCRRGVTAARPEGMGALVAGTQGRTVTVVWWVVLLVAGGFAVPAVPWLGPVAVAFAGAATWLLRHHVVRRLGGITGDVLGGCAELATTVTLAGFAFGTGP